MTTNEFKALREAIESRYRSGMAALEQLWTALTGTDPPDSPIVNAGRGDDEHPGLRSAESLGIPSAVRIEDGHRTYTKRKVVLTPQAAAKKKAYMKLYWQKRKREKAK